MWQRAVGPDGIARRCEQGLFVEEGAIIEVARRTMTEAGFADQSEFLQRNSFELALPKKST